MLTRPVRFNFYFPGTALLLILAGLLPAGCASLKQPGKNDEITTIRFHIEVSPNQTDHAHAIPVYRANPQLVNVDTSFVINENDVAHASVDGTNGLFAIRLEFTHHGAIVLDTITTANKGRRLAIFSQFGDVRWLAAPIIRKTMRDGIFVFTPDASPEEAERIVRGLNNLSRKNNNKKDAPF